MNGHSKLRNRAVANAFSQMGLVEAWGTGLHRIQNAAREYGLPEVEFVEMPESFRVNLFRKISPKREQADAGESSVKFGESSVKFGEKELNDTQSKIVLMIKQDRGISASEMADKLNLSVRAIEKNIRELRDLGILIRHGAARGGYWEISEKVTL